jgi:hypothetical protein
MWIRIGKAFGKAAAFASALQAQYGSGTTGSSGVAMGTPNGGQRLIFKFVVVKGR